MLTIRVAVSAIKNDGDTEKEKNFFFIPRLFFSLPLTTPYLFVSYHSLSSFLQTLRKNWFENKDLRKKICNA